ncbi:DUF4156 domain-containing protein [Exilibacterium tricleocarpae]|uniref:DUF4156 domain-containing protein n=1 Tax=Exilibacterium tricleocarpae TaxID=2591008 RepID=A0A545U6W6_9GAMM|nr:DUF4156 domain-containing protein [Exilibacterium tricleocarpae]TQV85184.1 DUF4156 domain-containing protein [Exilibacterium tricleocarpae]
MKRSLLLLCFASLVGCAANKLVPGAERVELVNESPDKARCKYVGEIVGSQGNWFTGDITSNENLVIGARNELRNKAHQLGANLVYIQDMKNTNAYGSLGTTNTTAVGKAYRCKT